ncbi:MAG: sulfatase-like hydrolase/transferase [Litorimonas sp.]
MRTWILSLIGLAASGCTGKTPPESAEAPPAQSVAPHIVVMIADDLGLDWAPCHGGGEDMPFLQSRCNTSRVYTRTYTHPYCTASRAAMMTGLHTARTGANDVDFAARKLTAAHVLIPEAARTGGSAHRFSGFGKWHLSGHDGGFEGPTQQGFDHHAGNPRQHDLYRFFDYDWHVNGEARDRVEGEYKTTRIVDAALRDFSDHAPKGPQFQWIGFVSPHIPYHVPPDALHDVEGLPPAGTEIRPTRTDPPEPGRFLINRPSDDMVPAFKAMLQALDAEIGRLVTTIEASTDRPVVFVFLGDNGTANEVFRGPQPPQPTYRAKATVFEGGARVPLMIWSSHGDGPLVPPGQDDRLTHLGDLFPTLVTLSGASEAGSPDMQSLLPFGDSPGHDVVYLERGHDRRLPYAFAAVDRNGLKIILREQGRPDHLGADGAVALYQTLTDPAEADNLFPDRLCAHREALPPLLDQIVYANANSDYSRFDRETFQPLLDAALETCETSP